jgi:hypothetical protein
LALVVSKITATQVARIQSGAGAGLPEWQA